jgi:hypothetical protein
MAELLKEVRATVAELDGVEDPRMAVIAQALGQALAQAEESTEYVLQGLQDDVSVALGASFDYLMQTGFLFGGWHMARSALVALRRVRQNSDNPFYQQKIATAVFYAEQILPRCAGHAGAVAAASGSLQSYPLDWV